MSKEITKANILQEMQDKLGLREFEPGRFTFSEEVVPVYSIEQHLTKWLSEGITVSITSAYGFVLFTVPENERWAIRRYNVIFLAAGAYTVAGVYVERKAGDYLYLDLTGSQTISYAVNLSQDVTLNAGEKLRINIDGYTSTASLRVHIDVNKETLR